MFQFCLRRERGVTVHVGTVSGVPASPAACRDPSQRCGQGARGCLMFVRWPNVGP